MAKYQFETPGSTGRPNLSRRNTGGSSSSISKLTLNSFLDLLKEDKNNPAFAPLAAGMADRFFDRRDTEEHEHAIDAYSTALDLYQNQSDKEQEIIHIQNQLGLLYTEKSQFDLAEKYFNQALEVVPEESLEQAQTLYHRGLMYQAQESYAGAIDDFNQAQENYATLNKQYEQAQVLYALGVTYLAQTNSEQAIVSLKQALVVFQDEEIERGEHLADCLRYLGVCFLQQEAWDEALTHLNTAAEKYNLLANKHEELGLTRKLIASIKIKQNKWDEAQENLQLALLALDKETNNEVVAETLESLGTVQKQLGLIDMAQDSWNQALDKYRAINDTDLYNPQIEALCNLIGLAYLEHGQYEYAISSFEQILDFYIDLGDTAHVNTAAAYRHIGEAHLANENLADAKTYLSKAHQMYQSLSLGAPSAEVALLLHRTTAPHNPSPVPSTGAIIRNNVVVPDHLSINHSSGSESTDPKSGMSLTECLCTCGGFFATNPSKTAVKKQHNVADNSADIISPLVSPNSMIPGYGTQTEN